MARGGTTTIEVTQFGEVVRVLHQSQRHADELLRRADAVGDVDHVRGDRQRSGRRSRLHAVSNVPLQQPHGFIFEVPADGQSNREPITQAGRFPHEAVAVDPATGVIYMTEDNFEFPSGFYRFIPPRTRWSTGISRTPARSRCWPCAESGTPTSPSRNGRRATYHVEWVDIEDPNPTFPFTPGSRRRPRTTTPSHTSAPRASPRVRPASRGSKALTYDDGVIYFTSTQGGGPAEPALKDEAQGWGNGNGQVWAYRIPGRRSCNCIYQSPGPDVLDFPDNVTISDGARSSCARTTSTTTSFAGSTRGGQLFDIALNRLGAAPAGHPASTTSSPAPRSAPTGTHSS